MRLSGHVRFVSTRREPAKLSQPPYLTSSLSARLSTLPTIVFGSSVRNSTRDGTLYGARCCRQKSRSSLSRRLAGAQDHPRGHRFALARVGDTRDADFGDCRVCRDHLFDLARPHLKAARLDQILLPIDDEEISVLVQIAEIACVQPAPGGAASACSRSAAAVSSGRFQKPIISCGAKKAISPTPSPAARVFPTRYRRSARAHPAAASRPIRACSGR